MLQLPHCQRNNLVGMGNCSYLCIVSQKRDICLTKNNTIMKFVTTKIVKDGAVEQYLTINQVKGLLSFVAEVKREIRLGCYEDDVIMMLSAQASALDTLSVNLDRYVD